MSIRVRSRVLVVLTLVSILRAVAAGRRIPAQAPLIFTASSTPTPQIELRSTTETSSTAQAAAADHQIPALTWKRRRHPQDNAPPDNISIFRRGNRLSIFRRRDAMHSHRLLLGSAPPSCQGKCGSCVPCFPIHVSLGGPHAGSVTVQEYYPEAWRCKCDNRTFMP